MPAVVVLGAQWGDEGKAKIIDLLAERAYGVVRYQGGCNAGHTVVCQGETFKFHLIPSGILYPGRQCIIGPGTVIAPTVFQQELDTLKSRGIDTRHLHVSPKAHLTLPYHVDIDGAREDALGEDKIGTTRRGIGPTYEDKVTRIGLRVGDLLLAETDLRDKLNRLAQQKNPVLATLYGLAPIDPEHYMMLCADYRQILGPFITDTDTLLADALSASHTLLLEGAQGAMLDLDHGTYPYVTSSNPTVGGVCTGAGIAPRFIQQVIGVAKAYTTRVGGGPFPTELFEDNGRHLSQVGQEFGTTTGRPRRCGWFDAVALRYAARLNGLDSLALTKLDVLTGLPEIKLCVGYTHRQTGEAIDVYPWDSTTLDQCQPVYESFPGWTTSVREVREYADLPAAARTFLARLSEVVQVPLSMISVGPDRTETILLDQTMPLSPPEALLKRGA